MTVVREKPRLPGANIAIMGATKQITAHMINTVSIPKAVVSGVKLTRPIGAKP